jgi:diaminopimelate epimerase
LEQKISYHLMDPTKNYTILVDTPVPEEEQAAVAAELMRRVPLAEQAGFVSPVSDQDPVDTDIAVRMAGGEFCGNASMCTAVYAVTHGYAKRYDPQENAHGVRIAFRGQERPIRVQVRPQEDGSFACTVEMPEVLGISVQQFDPCEGFPEGISLPVVFFPGIAHAIVETEKTPGASLIRERAERLLPLWCAQLGAEAMGLMFLDAETGHAPVRTLSPLVYVADIGSLFWENSCASGSTAVGAYLGLPEIVLSQPGGILRVSCTQDGKLLLSGTVRV